MANTLQISDGTTTVDLSDASAGILDYAPKGAWSSDESIDEEAYINFLSRATGQTRINQINTIFARARMRATTGVGPRCFVNFAFNGGATYRSELLDGYINVGDNTLGSDTAADNVYARVGWRRVPYWEGAVAQLAISNTNGSNNTAGLTVNNHSVSGSASAWFSVSGASIAGDVPAPVRVEMTNSAGLSLGYMQYGLVCGTTAWNHVACLQGESAAYGSGGTNTGSGTSSNGNYLSLVVVAGSSTNYTRWTVTNSILGISDGKPVVPVARFDGASPTLEYMRVYCAGLYTEYAQTTSTRKYVVMPPMPFPPRTMNGGAYASHTIEINYWNPGGSSDTVKLDYLALIPAGDGWREINSLAGADNIANTETLIDDGIEQLTYSLTGGNRLSTYSTSGKWPLIIPGVDGTFATFSADNAVGNALPSYSWTAKLYYRPRRRSI